MNVTLENYLRSAHPLYRGGFQILASLESCHSLLWRVTSAPTLLTNLTTRTAPHKISQFDIRNVCTTSVQIATASGTGGSNISTQLLQNSSKDLSNWTPY